MDNQEKKKIAILGGGMAGLTAAFELTANEDLRAKHDVTIHQMGWRLGGKCATGRGVFDRIEEHGIHAFVGSYYNALGLMSACYDELKTLRENGKITAGVLEDFSTAFRPADSVVLWEWFDQGMVSWPFAMANNNLEIGTHEQFKKSLEHVKKIIAGTAAIGRLYYDDQVRPRAAAPAGASAPGGFWSGVVFAVSLLLWLLRRLPQVSAYLRLLHRKGVRTAYVRTLLSWFFVKNSAIPMSYRFRRFGLLVNYAFTLIRGVFDPRYNIFANGFDVIDNENYIDWLRDHWLSKDSEAAPIAINSIDITYNYPDGDNSRQPLMAAGTYLRWSLRQFLNLQAFVWSFEAGTGETVIAPLYHVLKNRGVKFAFFHKVTGLTLSADGKSIGAVDIDVQAQLKEGIGEYDPLIRVDYDPKKPEKFLLCWPSRPKFELLAQGDQLDAQGVDFESYWASAAQEGAVAVPSDHLTLTAGADYHDIVFAISVGAVPELFPGLDIMGDLSPPNPQEPPQTAKWRAMVAGVPTCATQSLQLWFNDSSDGLGVAALNPADPSRYGVVSGTFIAPFNGQADFTRLIHYEGWDRPAWQAQVKQKPGSLWYFSGALTLACRKPGDPPPAPAVPNNQVMGPRATIRPFAEADFPAQQAQRVWDFSVQFLQATAGYLLPDATSPWQPLGLNFDKLHGLGALDTGAAPAVVQQRAALVQRYNLAPSANGVLALQNQYWRANVEPTERYVQCPPGGAKARLRTDQTGFDNMVLAGDWIQNHLCIGSVEGAVMGGRLAANALCASPELSDIVGY